MGSPQPIEWPDIQAFVALSGVMLSPWEIETLERLDDLYVRREEQPAESATRPMTEKLFDAIFA